MSGLEKKLFSASEAPPLDERILYMPDGTHEKSESLWKQLHGYWLEPHTAWERAAYVVFPGPYTMWKMPPKLHNYLNRLLDYAHKAASLTGGPALKAASGIVYAISETVYGLKTSSGKRTTNGLVGIIHHLREADDGKLAGFLDHAERVVSDYMKSFNPALA